MKIGYIHTNHEEQARVLQVMKMLTEPVALDELGIGRIRDAFADMMFPCLSTLQKHMKYFSLMPQVYKRATERRYNRLSEVRGEIVRLERLMTENLIKGSPEGTTGITGSEAVKSASYVKYDPAYIYNSGLQMFGILRSTQVDELIYATSKSLHATPTKYKSRDDDDEMDSDADGKGGLFQFCSFPNVEYDFTNYCSITLTEADKQFITEHILRSKDCEGSLFRFLIEHPDYELGNSFEDIDPKSLPAGVAAVVDRAQCFADFIYIVHLRYNWIFSNYQDEEMLKEFSEALERYKQTGTDIDEVLQAVKIRDNSSKSFCHDMAEDMAAGDWKSLDDHIKDREHRVKGSRRKIGNKPYEHRIHYYKLSYRWETAKTFIHELREKGVANG